MTLASLIEQERRPSLTDGEQRESKKAAALRVLELVEDGMVIGLGTGSTVRYFLEGLAQRISQEGLNIRGVPTSHGTEQMARDLNISLGEDLSFSDLSNDLCVDGADRVDATGHLVKGGGGALLREKMVAYHSRRLCILVDPTKLISVFDDSFLIPIECLCFGIGSTMDRLRTLGCEPRLRSKDGETKITDNGHCIVDARFNEIPDPRSLSLAISALPGVVEVGLFVSMMTTLVVGRPDGSALAWSHP